MNVVIGSYNIWLGKAFEEAGEMAGAQGLDVLCLQECKEEQIHQTLGGLSLAGMTQLDQVMLAMYYDTSSLALVDFNSFKLPPAWYERNRMDNRTRLQLARFMLIGSNAEFLIGNLHLANMATPNRDRKKQLAAALETVNEQRGPAPAVVVGDTNYLFFETGLDSIVTDAGFSEFGKETEGKTHTSKLAKSKLDRVFMSEGITGLQHRILPITVSDHAAVVAELQVLE